MERADIIDEKVLRAKKLGFRKKEKKDDRRHADEGKRAKSFCSEWY